MATAARLSVKGHQVTIVEQSDQVGGKAGAYSRDGFVFDTGPSLITLPAVYRDLFLKTGTSLEDNVDLQPVEPGTSYRWSDGTRVTLPGVNRPLPPPRLVTRSAEPRGKIGSPS